MIDKIKTKIQIWMKNITCRRCKILAAVIAVMVVAYIISK